MEYQTCKNFRAVVLLSLLTGLFLITACAKVVVKKPEVDWVEETLASLSLEEKVGQLITVRYSGNFVNQESPYFKERIEKEITRNHLGGFILYGGNIAETALLTNRMQSLSKVPLLISSDLERGLGNQLTGGIQFPHNMAFGAAESDSLAYLQGKITAIEARAAGIHQTYAPVVDVNNNPDNPIINIRSYGETPELVSLLGAAFIRGCQENGLIATAKHFPGHGDTDVDSHSRLAVINGDMTQLYKMELPPFRAAIDAGVKSIMTAHIAVPILDGVNVPGTLSLNILTGLLRRSLNFDGLIVTDAMEMGGITNEYSIVDASVATVQAGSDMVLLPPDVSMALRGITAAVRRGVIPEERIDASVRRILKTKQWLGLDKNRYVDITKVEEIIGLPEHEAVANEVAERSITLVRNKDNIVPVNPLTAPSTLVITITSDRDSDPGGVFKSTIRSLMPTAGTATIDRRTNELEMENILERVQASEQIICGMFVQVRANKDFIALDENQSRYFRQILDLKKPVIVSAFGSPYVLQQFPEIETYLCAYSYTPSSQTAAGKALFGQQPVTGRLPVTIPGLHQFGEGIQITEDMIAHIETPGRVLREISPYAAGFTRIFPDNLSAILRDGVEQKVAPAIVCVAGRGGRILFNEAFGSMTYDPDSEPVTTESIFDLASVTKVTATTTLSMIFYDRGLFKLDEPVSTYLPEMKNGGKFTVRNLLTHTSGLPAYIRFYRDYKGKDEILSQIFQTDLEYEPGTKYVYSDIGMMLMATILERAAGKPLDVLAMEEIFEPLDMNDTYFNPAKGDSVLDRIVPTEDDPWRGRVVLGEVHDENAYAYGGVAGHAGLFSTGSDLAKLCQMLLNGGIYGEKRLIRPLTVELFTSRQNLIPDNSRALGWDTRSSERSSSGLYFSDTSNGHTGFTGTSIWIDPERDLFVILLTNRVHPTRANQKISAFRRLVHDTIMEMMRR